ncbi:uncharacterized protein BT62DRAFT_706531 [Guyanagaster necrorhizus]|uniref:Uncharacterized protein n=1 Tax=Guyanagaster necrorhizus TaxID=856835 RepID=A0A9P8AUG1_9AGAR|nr:uncharacterized protein BT62DRAFT_706531 [Guyanagaster necrorhizus MCA 3950]KAG7448443.1 hypothetical protein BT62DRAFT_706531 [Guyanagaster necrorhizus MCA 3950]
MAPIKSEKVAKYTYAERVLNSMTQLQREHKKQSINLISLRAHIKKIAEKKRDRLGPNWSNWVGRAVAKLEDDGVLTASAPGCVMLTPSGKKAITAARRSILSTVPPGTFGSPAQEDLVTKLAIKDRGTKRPLRRSLAASDANSVTSPSTARVKRMRMSIGEITPISKMTKAQLKVELASVKKAYELALLRATSPLTDLSDEDGRAIESERFHEELKMREQEIAVIRAELEDARRQAESDGTQIQMANRTELSTPMTPYHAERLHGMHPGGVTRTQSGTIIPDVSRHPTPPSSPPSMEYGNMGDNDLDIPDVFSLSLMSRTRCENEENDRGSCGDILNDVEPMSILNDKVTALQHDLDIRSEDLRNTTNILNENHTVLEELRIDNATLAKQNDDIAHQLSDFKDMAQNEAQKNAALIISLKHSIQELHSDNSLLKDFKVRLVSTNTTLLEQVKELEPMKEALMKLMQERDQLQKEKDEGKSALESLHYGLKYAQEETATAKAEVGALSLEKVALLMETNNYKAEIEKELSDQRAESAQSLKENTRIQKEQAELNTSFEACRIELEAKDIQIKDLSASLQEKVLLLDGSLDKIKLMQEVTNDLHKEIACRHEAMESLRDEKDSHIQKMDQAATDLRTALNMETSRYETAAGALCETQALLSDLRSVLETQIAATDASQLSFQQEQVRGVSLCDELVRAMNRAEAAEEEVTELRASKSTDEETISSLKAMFERFKTTQMIAFKEFEGQVSSAGPSPSPVRNAVIRS